MDTYYQLLLAEQHGQLQQTLQHFACYLKMRKDQLTKLKHLLEYPIMLLGLLTIMIAMMTVFVFPQLAEIRPEATGNFWQPVFKIMAWISGAGVTFGIFKMIEFYRLTKLEQVRSLCRAPIIGGIIRNYYGYYLCSNFAILLTEGISTQQMIKICNCFDKCSLLYQLSRKIASLTVNGQDPTQLIHQEMFLPDELAIIIRQGADNQKLAQQVQSLSEQLFKRLIYKCEQRLIYVQPVVYLIIAIVIISLYLQILMPIYQTVQVIKWEKEKDLHY